MNIVIATSKEYVKYAKVMLLSLFESGSDKKYDIYCFYHEDIEEILDRLNSWIKDYPAHLHPIRVSDDICSLTYKSISSSPYSIANIYRFACVDLLPQNIDRVLMLGIDIIIKNSIEKLYYMDIPQDKWFVMCQDMPKLCGEGYSFYPEAKQAEQFGVDLLQEYYNSDVTLINLKECRKGGFQFKDFVDSIKKNQFFFLDQDVLSLILHNRIQKADAFQYNYLVNIYSADKRYRKIEDIKIVHYAGTFEKPWKYQDDSWYNKLWWSFAKKCFNETEYEALKTESQISLTQMLDKLRESEFICRETALKYQLYYEFFCKCESSRIDGKIQFALNKSKTIALYGYGGLGRILYQQLLDAGYTISGVIDKTEHANITTIAPDNIEAAGADIIVITPIYDYYQIKKKLDNRCNAQIISALDII